MFCHQGSFKAMLGILLWLGICLLSTYWMMSYDFIPGRVGFKLNQWPSETHLSLTPGKTTVIAFLHPKCVCTKATVNQLIHTLEAHPDASLIAAVFTPKNLYDKQEWKENAYVRAIRTQVPNARIFYDEEGVEARRFGAFTSGSILVFDAKGKEIFQGGITDRRGGEKNNPGLQQFRSALTDGTDYSFNESAPVFGCPIIYPDKGLKKR